MKLSSSGYFVHFEENTFSYLEKFIAGYTFSSVYILCDSHTKKYCLPLFLQKNKFLKGAKVFSIPAGEKYKTLETVNSCWNFLLKNNADRRSLLICLGGGVTCDLGGFAASTFKRGISFIHIPTTLLAMADASVGGKTGIDYKGYKNLIGTFNQPKGVFIFEKFLRPLPKRHIENGFAEIIKAALIGDAKLWTKFLTSSKFLDTNPDLFIKASVRIKNSIVLKDPFEKNIRQALNFGHTSGHAIESFFLGKKKELLHGEAIIIGMCVELCLGKLIKSTEPKHAIEGFLFLKKHFLLRKFSAKEISSFIQLMRHDKKNRDSQIIFALIAGPGKPLINVHASTDEIRSAFELYNNLLL